MKLISLLYIGFRLTPFILISFFVISSLISSDVRGLIFLALLLANLFITHMFGELLTLVIDPIEIADDRIAMCNSISIGNIGRFSKMPLNINILTFTYTYLVCLAVLNNKVFIIIPAIVVFSLLLLAMIGWEVTYSCVSIPYIVASMAVAIGLGIGFAELMDKHFKDFIFFGSVSTTEVCKRNSDDVFECEPEQPTL